MRQMAQSEYCNELAVQCNKPVVQCNEPAFEWSRGSFVPSVTMADDPCGEGDIADEMM